MSLEIIQNILIILLAGYLVIDNLGITIINTWAVTTGLCAGLIMGDLKTGLLIGGTFQLMSLGVAGLGGASVPDYSLATLVGTFLAVRTGSGLSTAIAVGLPVGLLAINLDVLVKILNNFVAHKMQTLLHQHKFREMRLVGLAGPAMFAFKNMLVMFIIVVLGPNAVKAVLKVVPTWVTTGLNVAGGMLPVLGIALLMHYMPVKKYIWAVMAGYVLSAYLKLPIIGVSILGAAAAIVVFRNGIKDSEQKKQQAQAIASSNVNNGIKSKDAVQALKTSLMGPFAGVGDTIIWILLPTVMGSIAGYMALQGNPIGAIIWILIGMLLFWIRIKLFDLGYNSGVKLVTELGDKLTLFTDAVSVMGRRYVGCNSSQSIYSFKIYDWESNYVSANRNF